MLIAERLRCFPGMLQLCYRLSTDKPKASAISIQSDEQFTIFLSQMRMLVVPQRLASGKISTRQIKPITVIFEDGSQDKVVPDSQSGGGKKVRVHIVRQTKMLIPNCYCRALANPLANLPARNHRWLLTAMPRRRMLSVMNEWQPLMSCGSSGAVRPIQKRRTHFAGNPTACATCCPTKICASGLLRLYVFLFLHLNLLMSNMVTRLRSMPPSTQSLLIFTSMRLTHALEHQQDPQQILCSVADGMAPRMPQLRPSHNIPPAAMRDTSPSHHHSPSDARIQLKSLMSTLGADFLMRIPAEIVMGSFLLRMAKY